MIGIACLLFVSPSSFGFGIWHGDIWFGNLCRVFGLDGFCSFFCCIELITFVMPHKSCCEDFLWSERVFNTMPSVFR